MQRSLVFAYVSAYLHTLSLKTMQILYYKFHTDIIPNYFIKNSTTYIAITIFLNTCNVSSAKLHLDIIKIVLSTKIVIQKAK